MNYQKESIVEKEVAMSSTGELNFQIPQQEWTGSDAIQSSYFAGQAMFIKKADEQADEFELHYLGLKVSGFEAIDDAKFNAPEFARSVFQILGDFIKDN
jgi:hypothetical protein